MFFNKPEIITHRFKAIPPTTEECDLMRKLCDDLQDVLNRHRDLCGDTCQPNVVYSMQINVLTHVLVNYFVQLYNSTKPIIPYMNMFLTHLNDIIHQSTKKHG